MKRIFDVLASGIGMILFGPVLLGLAALIKAGSRGPVFYRGIRAGRGGRPFRIFKFRSMVVNAESLGGASTAKDDPRVTPVGEFMRRFKLDELPQLLNVLVGDMSLVGPRPDVLSEIGEYTGEYGQVLELRPGITDWASIWNSDEGAVLEGAPDPHQTYKEVIQPTKLELQLKYYHERSFDVDARILLYTAIRLFRRCWLPSELRPYGQPQRSPTAGAVDPELYGSDPARKE